LDLRGLLLRGGRRTQEEPGGRERERKECEVGGRVTAERRMEGRGEGEGGEENREGLPPLEWRSGYAHGRALNL